MDQVQKKFSKKGFRVSIRSAGVKTRLTRSLNYLMFKMSLGCILDIPDYP